MSHYEFSFGKGRLFFIPVKEHLQFREKEDSEVEFQSRVTGFKPALLISPLHMLPGSRYLLEITLLTLNLLLGFLFQFLHDFPWRRFGIRLLPIYQMISTQSCYFWKLLAIWKYLECFFPCQNIRLGLGEILIINWFCLERSQYLVCFLGWTLRLSSRVLAHVLQQITWCVWMVLRNFWNSTKGCYFLVWWE